MTRQSEDSSLTDPYHMNAKADKKRCYQSTSKKRSKHLLWFIMYSVNSHKCLPLNNIKRGGEFLTGTSKESKVKFPQSSSRERGEREQRSQGGSRVGAETLGLWERNIGERTNWDPIAWGEMLLCWCRERGKHRPIYCGKIVLWWSKKKKKKKRDLRADLGHSSLCNLIWALREDGWKQTLFSRQQPWQNI